MMNTIYNVFQKYHQLIVICFLVINIGKCNGVCYFSPELQGTFITQGSIISTNQIQYSQINITEYSIPIWGICYRRINNNIILMISSDDDTTCYRCFNLKLLSRNILKVITTDKDYISKCYANEEKALASCPNHILIHQKQYTEIILYKSLEMDGQEIRKEYCPINGRYRFTYQNHLNTDENNNIECSTLDSVLDNCPSGSAMNLRFKKCSFENHDLTYECLGHWIGNNQKKYLALLNTKYNDNQFGPKYRCALYNENSKTGIINIILSKDSTCSSFYQYENDNKIENQQIQSQSHNQQQQQPKSIENLILYPNITNNWPSQNYCQFPEYLHGNWEYITIKNDTLIYNDQTSFKSYTIKCIEYMINSQNNNHKILVFSRTQCDEETYQCLNIQYRSKNILEFQISSYLSNVYNLDICNDIYFNNQDWLTQGRLDHQYQYSSCPINGEFNGTIPDASNLCTKLSSDCQSDDIMYYEVTACNNAEVYEERKYRCLGQWQENNFIYTYTRRLDVGTYECFVGGMINENSNQLFIKEAGENCQRHINPFRHGMELNKTGFCNETAIQLFPIISTTPIIHQDRHQKANNDDHSYHHMNQNEDILINVQTNHTQSINLDSSLLHSIVIPKSSQQHSPTKYITVSPIEYDHNNIMLLSTTSKTNDNSIINESTNYNEPLHNRNNNNHNHNNNIDDTQIDNDQIQTKNLNTNSMKTGNWINNDTNSKTESMNNSATNHQLYFHIESILFVVLILIQLSLH